MQSRSSFAVPGATYSGRNLHGLVVHELGRRIVGGSYPQGRPLPSEGALCLQLAVSRTALREAIKVLAAKGLIDSKPRVGTLVRPSESWNLLDPDVLAWRCSTGPDSQFLLQLAELRHIVEPQAAALAARNRSDEQLLRIESAFAAMAAAADLDEWIRADLQFHTAILRAAGNPLLMPLAAMVGSALESLLSIEASKSCDLEAALRDHGKVLDAIRSRDEASALHRMASLVSEMRGLVIQAFGPTEISAER